MCTSASISMVGISFAADSGDSAPIFTYRDVTRNRSISTGHRGDLTAGARHRILSLK